MAFGPEPYLLSHISRQMPRLLLFETLVHHIDTARFLFGEPNLTVYAHFAA